jgi:hypothetical protein
MTPFSDQLSAVRQAQFEAQLDFFRTYTSRALDSAGQLAALNMRTSRASVEQAAGAVRQLLEVRDPRDLFALGSAAQGQWQTLFSYGRELAGLAAGVRAVPASIPLLAAPAPTANVPTSYTQAVEQASIATDAAATLTGEIAAAAVDIGAAHAEAAIETAIASETPRAEPTALAKALNEVSPKPASAEHPLASTVPLEAAEGQVELPTVTPPESIAPVIAPPPKASRSLRRK